MPQIPNKRKARCWVLWLKHRDGGYSYDESRLPLWATPGEAAQIATKKVESLPSDFRKTIAKYWMQETTEVCEIAPREPESGLISMLQPCAQANPGG